MGQIHHAAHGRFHDRKWICPEESWSSWRVPWRRLLAETAARGVKPTLKLVLWQELAVHRGPMVEQVVV